MLWRWRWRWKVTLAASTELEVLGDLVLIDHPAHAQSDGIGALELARLDPSLDRRQVALGGGE